MNKQQKKQRRGIIVPLIGIMLPILIVLIVFAVDYGAITVAQHQLQNAADAGAVSTLKVLLGDRQAADTAATETIGNNRLLGESISIDLQDDVEYGSWNSDTNTFDVIARNGSAVPEGATAVRITLERTREEGNGVSLLFAPILGIDFADIRVTAIAAASTPCSGFIGIDSVDLRNNMITESYDSTDGPISPYSSNGRLGGGDVCSAGPVTLASGADVYGNAQGSSVSIASGSGASISGSSVNSPIPDDFPAIDFTSASSHNNNNSIERGPTWAPPFYNSSTNDLVINNGRSMTLEAGTYYFRDLNLAGGSTLNVNGEVKIFIEREMRFDNGTVANQSQIPLNMQISVGSGPVNIQGGHQLHATIYSPGADVSIANGSGFFGSIIGKSLSVAGGAGLFYDESLADNSTGGSSPSLVW